MTTDTNNQYIRNSVGTIVNTYTDYIGNIQNAYYCQILTACSSLVNTVALFTYDWVAVGKATYQAELDAGITATDFSCSSDFPERLSNALTSASDIGLSDQINTTSVRSLCANLVSDYGDATTTNSDINGWVSTYNTNACHTAFSLAWDWC